MPRPLTAEELLPPSRAETNLPPSQNISGLNLMPSSRLSWRLTPTYERPNPFDSSQQQSINPFLSGEPDSQHLQTIPEINPFDRGSTSSATSTLRSSNPFGQEPTVASASTSTPTGMRSSRIDFEQLTQPPTPVPTGFRSELRPPPSVSFPGTVTGVDLSNPQSSLSSALLEPIATVPGQPTKVSAEAMTPMIKKARKPRARNPKEVTELENLGYQQVERLQTFSNSDL